MTNPKIIVLFGKQRAGKSSAALSLTSRFNFQAVSFAGPLYAMLATLMGITVEELRKLDKNEPQAALEGKSIRFALQSLGTEWGRDTIGGSLWLNRCRDQVLKCHTLNKSVVIDDCRFHNEYLMLWELGATFVRIERPEGPATVGEAHGSEQDWHSFRADVTVINDRATEEAWLNSAADQILDLCACHADVML